MSEDERNQRHREKVQWLWDKLRSCRKGLHCSCEIAGHCCFCELRDMRDVDQVALSAPFGSTQEQIQAFLDEAKE